MINRLSFVVVLLVASYFLYLGLLILRRPGEAAKFLLGFASRADLHYLEIAIRILAGAAFVNSAPAMLAAPVFLAFGWILIVTSIALLLIPWRWHERFARRMVPRALEYLTLLAISALAMATIIISCAIAPLIIGTA